MATSLPLIPPKLARAPAPHVAFSYEQAADWYFVRSPRGERGAVGPVSLDDLKELYSETEINSNTLLWKDGMRDWKQLNSIHEVVCAVTTLPPIPNTVQEIMLRHSTRAIDVGADKSVQTIETPVLTEQCIHCGNPAELHLVGKLGNRTMETLLVSHGNTESSTEILPGFLWVGNRAALKQTNLDELQITYVINCNEEQPGRKESALATAGMHCPIHEPHPMNRQPSVDMTNQPKMRVNLATIDQSELLTGSLQAMRPNSPSNKPTPAFVPLTAPVARQRHPDDNVQELLQLFDRIFDVLQNRKIMAKQRVLVASRHGSDIACAVAAAYIIRDKHATMEEAMRHIIKARPNAKLSKQSRAAVHKYAQRYARGPYVCESCRAHNQEQARAIEESAPNTPADGHSRDVATNGPALQLKMMDDDNSLARQLQQAHSNITTIDLSSSRLSVEGFQTFVDSVKDLPSLAHLDLSNNPLQPDCRLALVKLFKQAQSLVSLNLATTGMDDSSLDAMSAIWSQCSANTSPQFNCVKTLTSLNLANNCLGREAISKLNEILHNSQVLHQLDISCNSRLVVDGSVRLGRYSSSLKRLSVSGIPLEPLHCAVIMSGSLEHLEAVSCKLQTGAIAVLAEWVLQQQIQLKHLDISVNPVMNAGAAEIARMLVHHPPILHLDMSDCSIGLQAAIDLAGALTTHPTINVLNLSSNALTTEGVDMLIDALKNHATLEELHLNNVGAGTKGSNAIFSAIARNRVLRVLSLGWNNIHDSAALRMANTLALNETITTLDLSFNQLTDDGITRLASGLEVTSRSTLPLRAVDLDIQLVGNPCTRDEYILPGLARSKLSHKFAQSSM